MQKNKFEFGIYSLGEMIPSEDGEAQHPAKRIEDMIQMGKMADEAGLDIFGIGEHHRQDFVTSSYAMILAAVARETRNIKLISSLSVISSMDPVRLYEDFSTLDLLSNGRAEIMVGRGAFVESFALFGADLKDYNELFDEKVKLFMTLQKSEVVNWQGKFRTSLKDAGIYPRPKNDEIPLWIGVGGTPESAVRAGKLGVNMALALLSGRPEDIKPLTDLYWSSAKDAGHDISKMRVSVSSHAHIADTGEQAVDEFYPKYMNYCGHFMRERGQLFYVPKLALNSQRASNQILAIGNSEEVAEKILCQYELFGHSRFMGQFDLGGQSLSKVEKSIDLLANKVAPMVRKALSDK